MKYSLTKAAELLGERYGRIYSAIREGVVTPEWVDGHRQLSADDLIVLRQRFAAVDKSIGRQPKGDVQ